MKVAQLVLEHPAQIRNAIGVQNSCNSDLATIDANGSALTRMIDTENLIHGLDSSHSCSYAWGGGKGINLVRRAR